MYKRQPESLFVNLLWAQESIPSLAGRYDNPFWRIGPPHFRGWRNRFLGIDSWAPLQIRALVFAFSSGIWWISHMDMVSPPSMCGAVVHCLPSIYWNSWLGEDIHPYQREASNEMNDLTQRLNIHCKKAYAIFPSPARMSVIKLSLAGNNWNYSRLGRVW